MYGNERKAIYNSVNLMFLDVQILTANLNLKATSLILENAYTVIGSVLEMYGMIIKIHIKHSLVHPKCKILNNFCRNFIFKVLMNFLLHRLFQFKKVIYTES